MIRRFAIVLSAALFLAAGLASEARCETSTYQQIVLEAQRMLAPMAAQRGLRLKMRVSGHDVVAGDILEATRERVINLMANAVAMAPEKATVTTVFDPVARRLTVFIEDSAQTRDLDRDVVDTHGNPFRVRLQAGRGTELCTSFQPTRLSDLP